MIQIALPVQIRTRPNKSPEFDYVYIWNLFTPTIKLPDKISIHLIYLLEGADPRYMFRQLDQFCIRFYLAINSLRWVLVGK